jgi:hypothetical protein
LFEEIEGQGTQLEQCLEGTVTENVIQEFVDQEALAKQHVEETQDKIEAFEV